VTCIAFEHDVAEDEAIAGLLHEEAEELGRSASGSRAPEGTLQLAAQS
jgi:hypothetical protein